VAPAQQLVAAREKAVADALVRGDGRTPSAAIPDVLTEGGNAVIRRLPLVDRRGVPLALALTGWLVVAGLGIIGYRHLEIINGADGLGPVRVQGTDDDAERFRTYLLWSIGEPGAVPGASALKPVTDLLGATAAGVPGAAWLQRVVDALTAAVAVDHGYTVEYKVLAEPKGAAGATMAVRVHVTRTGRLVGQHVATEPTKQEATRSAAYWAAAVIVSRSRKVPDWAEWSKETSDSLAAYFQESDAGDVDIDVLRKAVLEAPTSGLLCLKLANAEALEDNRFRAFELTLRVATLHPRYIAGRYRMAVTAHLLAADPVRYWDEAPLASREAVLGALARYGALGRHGGRPPSGCVFGPDELVNALNEKPDPGGDKKRIALCLFAETELHRLRHDTTRRIVVFNALRQRERSYWYELLRPTRGAMGFRRQFRQSIESCKLPVRARGGITVTPAELTIQEGRAGDPRTLWLITYNLACYHAIRRTHPDPAAVPGSIDHVGEAVRLLETAVERPGSYQLSRAWVDIDPDLQNLHNDHRFRRFQRSLGDRPVKLGGGSGRGR